MTDQPTMTIEQAHAYLADLSEQELRDRTEQCYVDSCEATDEEWKSCCLAALYMFSQEMNRRGLKRIPPQ
jgi:hypothetical protein